MSEATFTFSYGPHKSQFGILRLPSGSGPHPVVVVIHGGFWYDRFDLDLMHDVSHHLADHGYATWNIEYRRVGTDGGGWPTTLEDVSAAVNYLSVLSQQYPLNLQRIVTMGHSAGGHLAMWLAARSQLAQTPTDKPLKLGEDRLVRIHGAMSLAGVLDLERMWEVRQEDSPVVDFLGGTPSAVPNRYRAASPIDLLPFSIPQVLVHGDRDDRVPLEISERYYSRAMELGDTITLIELPDVDHFQLIDVTSVAWPPIMSALTELMTMI